MLIVGVGNQTILMDMGPKTGSAFVLGRLTRDSDCGISRVCLTNKILGRLARCGE